MFCHNCGAQIPDGSAVCPACGSAAGRQSQPPKKKNTLLIALIVLAAALLIAAVVLVVVLTTRDSGGSGGSKSSKGSSSKTEEEDDITLSDPSTPEGVLAKYAQAVLTGDAKTVVECLPEILIRAYAQEEDISTREAKQEIVDEYQDLLDDLADRYDDIDIGKIKSVQAEIRDEDKYTQKEVRELNEMYEDEYDLELNAEEVETVEVKIASKYDGDKFNFKITVALIKIDGSWYVMGDSCEALYAALYAELDDLGESGGSSDTEENNTLGGSSAEDVAERFIVGLFTDDVDAMTAQVPEELYEALVDMGEAGSLRQIKREAETEYQEVIDDFYDEVDILYGAEPRDVKVKVSGLKKDRNETQMWKDEVVDAYDDEYGITLKDFAVYTCTIAVTVDGDKETFDDIYVPLVKLGSKWYIDALDVNDLLFEPFI